MKFDADTLRARFHAAKVEKEAAEANMHPLIIEREALLASIKPFQDKLDAVNEKLKAARQPIYDLQTEMGQIAKFLRGPDGKSRL